MKLITGGVGVSHVSNTPESLRLYVNAEFAAAHNGSPGAPMLGLRKAVRAPDGWDLHWSPRAGTLSKPGLPSTTSMGWVLQRRWNGAARMPAGLPIGGKTPILRLREQDGDIIVTIPFDLNPSGKIGAIRRGRERRAAEAAGLSEVTQAVPPTCGVAELQDAIRAINTCIESMGDTLVLSLESEPRRLRAMIELG